MEILKTLRAVRFLFVGPLVFLMLVVINQTATPGADWLRWAGLGIGIAWVISLIRVVKAVIVVGGIAALIAFLRRRS
jgi:hypothetical protein